MKTNKIIFISAWLMLLVLAGTCAAKILTIRIMQEDTTTRWWINDRHVSIPELEGLLYKLASIDTNQVLYIVAQRNVPSDKLLQTIGIVQRAGLYNLGLICGGVDGTNSGTWWITIDAERKPLPSCTSDVQLLSGFQTNNNITELEVLPVIHNEKRAPKSP